MSDPRLIADKYLSRAGGPPQPTINQVSRDIMSVSNFMLWHSPDDMIGGVRMKEAWLAFCRLTNIEPHKIEQIIESPKWT